MVQWVRRRGGERYAGERARDFALRAQGLLARFPTSEASQALSDAAAYVVDRPL